MLTVEAVKTATLTTNSRRHCRTVAVFARLLIITSTQFGDASHEHTHTDGDGEMHTHEHTHTESGVAHTHDHGHGENHQHTSVQQV